MTLCSGPLQGNPWREPLDGSSGGSPPGFPQDWFPWRWFHGGVFWRGARWGFPGVYPRGGPLEESTGVGAMEGVPELSPACPQERVAVRGSPGGGPLE
jgi:hypothetical protein